MREQRGRIENAEFKTPRSWYNVAKEFGVTIMGGITVSDTT